MDDWQYDAEARAVVEANTETLRWRMQSAFGEGCQSPIEVMMLRSLLSVVSAGPYATPTLKVLKYGPESWQRVEFGVSLEPAKHCEVLFVRLQQPVGKFRADMMIDWLSLPMNAAGYRKKRRLFVECDGHDYHERTKKQAAHDKARDRFFTSMGLVVLRFTGSEIFADADGCAEEALHELARRVFA